MAGDPETDLVKVPHSPTPSQIYPSPRRHTSCSTSSSAGGWCVVRLCNVESLYLASCCQGNHPSIPSSSSSSDLPPFGTRLCGRRRSHLFDLEACGPEMCTDTRGHSLCGLSGCVSFVGPAQGSSGQAIVDRLTDIALDWPFHQLRFASMRPLHTTHVQRIYMRACVRARVCVRAVLCKQGAWGCRGKVSRTVC
jgi:hypothetical protein